MGGTAHTGGDQAGGRSEADATDELGEEIARLAADLGADAHRLLELVAELDRHGGRLTAEQEAVLELGLEAAEDWSAISTEDGGTGR